ncbi:hypothetical protein EZV62_001917 [Acer yangbiense]|uniref:Uncharacterized protein n=1 Tax=Acer yangbiense TaxID=1000413 RepID=A0A5C7IW72_9ROSI|nr:hypothetical protein EZV62_001917 [Acer yangbiense]
MAQEQASNLSENISEEKAHNNHSEGLIAVKVEPSFQIPTIQVTVDHEEEIEEFQILNHAINASDPFVVATTRRQQLSSDSGAFADWVGASSTNSAIRAAPDDLSLGFNAGPTAPISGSAAGPGSWSAAATRPINYGLPPEMGMVGLRDVFVVAPASFNHHHHHHDSINIANDPINGPNATTLGVGVGVGVIPLLTATPCLGTPQNMEDHQDLLNNNNNGRNKISQIQFWQNQSHTHHQYMKKTSSSILDHNNNNNSPLNLIQSSGFGGGGSGNNNNSNIGSGGNSGSSSGTTCQDCGNQAKKDCTHRRCRTCCKSRGFDCATHVKSTWVPAARRRERQLMAVGGTVGGAGSSGSTSGIKKPRLINSQTTTTSHTSTSNTTPPRSFDTTSSHQDATFKEALPGQVRAPAVFKCVRVTAVEDGEDEYAYQAVVKIGGHVFKGFLYDQGVDHQTREGFPNISELHLGGASSSGGGGGRNGGCSSSPILDPSDVYAAATGGGLLGGSSYGNQLN